MSTISERLVIASEICNVKGSILVSHCSLSDRKDREERQLSLIFELEKSSPFGVPSVLHLEISVPHIFLFGAQHFWLWITFRSVWSPRLLSEHP